MTEKPGRWDIGRVKLEARDEVVCSQRVVARDVDAELRRVVSRRIAGNRCVFAILAGLMGDPDLARCGGSLAAFQGGGVIAHCPGIGIDARLDLVASFEAADGVIAVARIQQIVAILAEQSVVAIAAERIVVTVLAEQHVPTGLASDEVVTGTGPGHVRPGPRHDVVGPGKAEYQVTTRIAEQQVILWRADDRPRCRRRRSIVVVVVVVIVPFIEDGAICGPIDRVQQFRELAISGAPLFLARQQVVVAAVDRPRPGAQVVGGNKTSRTKERRPSGMRFGELDLVENELQVASDVGYHDNSLRRPQRY